MSGKKQDYSYLIGQKFNKLTILSTYRDKNKVFCICLCDCGNICSVLKNHIERGATQSCGCLRNANIKDIIGKRFGKLIVDKIYQEDGYYTTYLCKCDCGNNCVVRRDYLIAGTIASCGCLGIQERTYKKLESTGSRIDNMYSERRGVSCRKKYNNWRAVIEHKGIFYHLGDFENYDAAVEARDKADEEIKQYDRVITYISSRVRNVYKLYWYHRIRDDDGYFMYAEPVITEYKNKHGLHDALVENMLWELKQYSFLYSGEITKLNVENIIRGIKDDFALKNPIVQEIKVSKTCIELEEYFKFEIR